MNWEQLASALIGAAFATRAADGNRGVVARVGYGLVAYDLVSNALGSATGASMGDARSLPRTPNKLQFQERRARNIQERVAYVHQQIMHGVRDPTVYSLAREVLSRKCGDDWCVKEKDHWGESVALFNEVKSRVRYTWDPLWYDAFQTPGKTLKLATGDCDDYASLLGAMCISVGLNVRSRVVQTTGESTWNHIYLMVNIPEQRTWRALDLSVKQPAGWEVPAKNIVKHKDFDVLEKSVPKLASMMGM